MAERDREPRIEERVGAAIGRTAGLVLRVPLGLIGEGAALFRHIVPQSHGPPGARPGLDLHAPVEPPTGAPPRVTAIDFGPASVSRYEVTDLDGFLRAPGAPEGQSRWLNIEGLEVGTVQRIARAYGLHPLAAEDVLHSPQRPKVEQFDDVGFLICRMLRIEEGHLVDEQVSLFVVGRVVITFQQVQGDVWGRIRSRFDQDSAPIRHRGAGYLIYALLDAIVDHCFPVLEHYGDLLADIEGELLDELEPGVDKRLHSIKRDLLILRRVLWPMRDVVVALRDRPPSWLADDTQAYMRDVHDHVVRVIDLLDTFRELANGLKDLHVSQQSHRMNEVMKVLTVMASIFIPITFLAGVWGMNFERMPELGWRYGYPAALGSFVAIGALLLVYFRRRGWL